MSEPKYNTVNDALELFARIADSRGDRFRATAYRRAQIAPSRAGKSIAQKIEEYKATGHIKELDDLLRTPDVSAYIIFGSILGFGPSTIRTLINNKILTRQELQNAIAHYTFIPTREQILGITYYDDLQRRIPRDQVARTSETIIAEIFRVVDREFANIKHEGAIVSVAGSFRRGAPSSRDIDILVALPTQRPLAKPKFRVKHARDDIDSMFLRLVRAQLNGDSRFIDVLSLGEQRFTFLYKWNHVMLIDIVCVPRESYFASLLYFTGSQLFNIWMREMFKLRGYKLNQYGLQKKSTKELIYLESEQHAFEILGIPYIPPHNRENPPEINA